MLKIEGFIQFRASEVRSRIKDLSGRVQNVSSDTSASVREELQREANVIADDFLNLETFVNINFTAFHKILKKHDKLLPNHACAEFYIARLHEQSWMQGDYSDVLENLADLYSALRGDQLIGTQQTAIATECVEQKATFWVPLQNLSRVIHAVSQHLPVYRPGRVAEEKDSELRNLLYFDNVAMEMYHSRLQWVHGSVMLRLSWQGSDKPNVVNLEKITQIQSFTNNYSVKESTEIDETAVLSLVSGTWTAPPAVAKSIDDVKVRLMNEATQIIRSKQLHPKLLVQFLQTQFQAPFDHSISILLETNLCMVSEVTKETRSRTAWSRDINKHVCADEITRFPHAVMEVKMSSVEHKSLPDWLKELVRLQVVKPVNRFSKFCHGSAVLFPMDVRTAPYWIDDESIASSVKQSGAARLLRDSASVEDRSKPRSSSEVTGGTPRSPACEHSSRGYGSVSSSIPYQLRQDLAMSVSPPPMEQTIGVYENASELCPSVGSQWRALCAPGSSAAHSREHNEEVTVEPKLILANERTFVRWIHMAVMLSSFSSGVLAFTNKTDKSHRTALFMLPLSLLFIMYALWTYFWRTELIRIKIVGR